MVHLRLVVPSDLASRVLGALEGSPAVCDIVHLPGAARRPAGDVVLCDVAREAASIVLVEIEEMGVHERGSISITRPNVVLSRFAFGPLASFSGRSRPGGGDQQSGLLLVLRRLLCRHRRDAVAHGPSFSAVAPRTCAGAPDARRERKPRCYASPRSPGRPFLTCPERCPSGLRSATGNRVGGETCLEGSNPSLSAA